MYILYIAYLCYATLLVPGQTINVWRPKTIKHCLVTKHFTVWTPWLVLFDRVWSCLIKFEGHQTLDKKRETFLLFSCLMGDVLFVWTPAYETCLMRACVPRLLSGLYQLFHLCLIKHALTVWPLTSTLVCLVSKQCLMVFGRQTFIVCPGPYAFIVHVCNILFWFALSWFLQL